MYTRAIWKYFLDINIFNLPFSIIIGIISGIPWSIISFSSFGLLIGLAGFQYFKENEYYAYYNLGFTKTDLIKKVCLLNIIFSTPLFIIYLIFE